MRIQIKTSKVLLAPTLPNKSTNCKACNNTLSNTKITANRKINQHQLTSKTSNLQLILNFKRSSKL